MCHKRYRNLLVDFHKDFPLLILVTSNLLSMPSPLSIGALLPLPKVHTSKTHSFKGDSQKERPGAAT